MPIRTLMVNAGEQFRDRMNGLLFATPEFGASPEPRCPAQRSSKRYTRRAIVSGSMPTMTDEQLTELVLRVMRQELEDKRHRDGKMRS